VNQTMCLFWEASLDSERILSSSQELSEMTEWHDMSLSILAHLHRPRESDRARAADLAAVRDGHGSSFVKDDDVFCRHSERVWRKAMREGRIRMPK
jgi:hypothetical protein